jgi:hypothetical protein
MENGRTRRWSTEWIYIERGKPEAKRQSVWTSQTLTLTGQLPVKAVDADVQNLNDLAEFINL